MKVDYFINIKKKGSLVILVKQYLNKRTSTFAC